MGEPEHGAAPWRLTNFKREAEPDTRAGTASNADRSATQNGEHDLRLPPLCRLGRAAMRSSCKRDQTGAAPVVGSTLAL